ncbi:hypothetical protein WH47_02958 [Habropoda laboriosa]|uniref:Uncharacterized protein n=1 Tax=Habropoda laboriosa TaxID=597456 RepID=A0A0L7QT92_9HYME|nr:hypothetical protein WH47_02958 [Habropoda laboriosa]
MRAVLSKTKDKNKNKSDKESMRKDVQEKIDKVSDTRRKRKKIEGEMIENIGNSRKYQNVTRMLQKKDTKGSKHRREKKTRFLNKKVIRKTRGKRKTAKEKKGNSAWNERFREGVLATQYSAANHL